MKKPAYIIISILALFQVWSMVSLAQTGSGNVLFSSADGVISIKSDAPLELIEASSNQMKGVIDITGRSFSFSVNNRSFKGFNSQLQQEHFYENYIEAGKYPQSTFKGKIIEQVDLSVDGDYQVRAKGVLSIHGIDQERIIKADIKVKRGRIQVSSSFTVPLSDHNITIPKIVYQKIAEEVVVSVSAGFTKVNK
ncbi:MAG: YceI family protein [Lentimicrobium sp.]